MQLLSKALHTGPPKQPIENPIRVPNITSWPESNIESQRVTLSHMRDSKPHMQPKIRKYLKESKTKTYFVRLFD